MQSTLAFLALAASTSATLLWDGRLNNYTDISYLGAWDWSNQVGPYQYYIHGSKPVQDYINLSPEAKNPADQSSKQGLRMSIDDTSSWNKQTMMRTELIPSTKAAINESKVFYHFSIRHTKTDPPTQNEEHQICFFESHFTELKYGPLSLESPNSNVLHWMTDGKSHWNVTLEAGVWHNVAYAIDFTAKTVGFWHSVGGEKLALTAGPFPAETKSDGQDWHLGMLRLPGPNGPSKKRESWEFSGVYIEDGELTKEISAAPSRRSCA